MNFLNVNKGCLRLPQCDLFLWFDPEMAEIGTPPPPGLDPAGFVPAWHSCARSSFRGDYTRWSLIGFVTDGRAIR